MFMQNVINGYTIFLTDVLIKRFGYNQNTAGILLELPYTIVMFGSPIFGLLIDKVGKRMWIITSTYVLLIVAHIILISTPNCESCIAPIIPIVFFGFGLINFYVLSNGSMVSFLVKDNTLGLAFGIMYSLQNISITVLPPLVGWIHDKSLNEEDGYLIAGMFFIVWATVGLIFTLALWIYDHKYMNSVL